MKAFIGTLLILAGIGLTAIPVVKRIHFWQDCGGHLELAANSNTVPTAIQELTTALTYIEENDLTKGFTSILWRTPDEDIGFWSTNLKSAYAELVALSPEAAPLEKSNMLIKLRETILAHNKDGEYVTVPDSIHKYPNNGAFALLGFIAFALIVGGILFILYAMHND